MLLITDTDQYTEKVIDHFEDEFGNKLNNLNMLETLTIVFKDGEKIFLTRDWRGNECYFSQAKSKR